MRVFLALASRQPVPRGVVPPGVLAAARGLIGEAFPAPAEVRREDAWVSPGGDVALLAWSNEPDDALLPPLLLREGGRVLGYGGYLVEPRDAGRLLAAQDLGAAVAATGGCFNVFRAGAEGLAAANTWSRVDPVYYAETPELHVAGSRALLVHLVARAAETGLEHPPIAYELLALQSIVRHGFFVSDDTPFQGVTTLPAASVLTVKGGHRTISSRPWPKPGSQRRGRGVGRRRVAGLAEALVTAVAPLRRHAEPVSLALSGGRDSRLLAAVLHAAGSRLRRSPAASPTIPT